MVPFCSAFRSSLVVVPAARGRRMLTCARPTERRRSPSRPSRETAAPKSTSRGRTRSNTSPSLLMMAGFILRERSGRQRTCESFRNACAAECSSSAGQFGNPANRRDDDAEVKQARARDRHLLERQCAKRTENIGLFPTAKFGPFLETFFRALAQRAEPLRC